MASPPSEEVIRQIAARNLAHFLLLKSLGLLEGPFFLAIDGPPGVGKSSLANPLKQFIKSAVGSVGITVKVGTFRQDDFLRSRADRRKEFAPEHGIDGVSGNCDRREYRWPQALECVKNISCGQKYTGFVYTPGASPDLQGPQCLDYSDLDILICEGTHSLGHDLFPYMHASVYLGATPELIRFNRLERGFIKQDRQWSMCQKTADVAESQYPKYIHPNSQRAQYLFELVTEGDLPEVDPSLKDSWPYVERHVQVTYDPFSCVIELTEEQKKAEQKLQQSGVLATVDGDLDQTIFAASGFFWDQLTDMFLAGGFQLHIPARDNSCFFSSVANAYPVLGVRNRDEAVALLKKLQELIRQGVLTQVQQQVIDDVQAILEHEIDFISNPHHWGGFTTLMYLWAASLGSEHPPTAPVYILFRLGVKVFILALNPDGTVTEHNALPASGNILVYDGSSHWMWAEHIQDMIPQGATVIVNDGDDEDSGFSSPMDSLTVLQQDPILRIQHSLREILINLLEIKLCAEMILPK